MAGVIGKSRSHLGIRRGLTQAYHHTRNELRLELNDEQLQTLCNGSEPRRKEIYVPRKKYHVSLTQGWTSNEGDVERLLLSIKP
ncbi:hypothetical protein [Selenomonas sp.]|uniref:hypothetical protein n=1 Tax=Selenomonas sp. TaxID=2053611 RepID=UPI0025F6B858|nr:hypothetical protein [Selenomonas sp.]MCI6085409.1 hypothetical protein [Selenomonas sp.]MDY3297754.1 hypothetical protein [Selenomonas sp.]